MEGAQIVEVEAPAAICVFRFRRILSRGCSGQTITGLGRRAKYLLADLASGDVLLMHLGMSGSFRVGADETTASEATTPGRFHHPRNEEQAHDHVVFHMSSGAIVTFNDPRRFGFMKIFAARRDRERAARCSVLGPEPLGNEFDAAMLARACANKKTSLKAALLDQRDRRRPRQHLCRARRCIARICRRSGKASIAGDTHGRADDRRRVALVDGDPGQC